MKRLFLFLLAAALCFSQFETLKAQTNSGYLKMMRLSSSGNYWYTYNTDKHLYRWSIPELLNKGDKLAFNIYAPDWVIMDSDKMAVSADGTWVVGGERHWSELVHFESGKGYDIKLPPRHAHFSPGGKYVNFIDEDKPGTGQLFRIALDNPEVIPEKPAMTFKVAREWQYWAREFKEDRFCVVSSIGTIEFYKFGIGKPYARFEFSDKSNLTAFSARGDYLLAGNAVYRIDSEAPQKLAELPPMGQYVFEAFVEGGKVFTLTNDTLRIFNALSGKMEKEGPAFDNPYHETVALLGVSPDASTVYLTGTAKLGVRALHLPSGNMLETCKEPMGAARNVAKLGDKERTIALVEEGFGQEKKPDVDYLKNDDLFAFLRGDQRWEDILSKDWYNSYEKKVRKARDMALSDRIDEAIAQYTEAIAMDSTRDEAFEGRANLCFMKKEYDNVLSDCRACLRHNAANVDCNLLMANAYYAQGKGTEASGYFREVALNDPSKYDYLLKSIKLSFNTNPGYARGNLKDYLAARRGDPEALGLQAELFEQDGETDNAAYAYKQAALQSGEDAYYKKAIDLFLSRQNRYEAREISTAWLNSEPGNPVAESYAAKAQEASKQTPVGGENKVVGTIPCDACNGSGAVKTETRCFSCQGKGKITCRRCQGRRYVYDSNGKGSYCGSCYGVGFHYCNMCNGSATQAGRGACNVCGGDGMK